VNIVTTSIFGPLIIEPAVFSDLRGHFFESFNPRIQAAIGEHHQFVQDNESLSQQHTVRGLHFQAPPFDQGKLVRVIKGAVLDVVVDIRVGSPTYGKHVSVELSDANKKMFWVPPGFAHGFSVLQPDTIFVYKCTAMYNKQAEGGILWNDPQLGIDWQVTNSIVSDKDLLLPTLQNLKSPFVYETNP
jgi:dTDP-4-dehydrorhamnose 3,5-epimerase